MQSIYISDLYSLSLKALRRDGVLLSPSQIWDYRGVVTLSRRSGYSEESVSFEISLQSSGEGNGSITFEYLRDGTPVKYSYRLEERESNLPSDPLTRRQLKTWERYLPESEDLESRIRPLTLPKFLR